MAVCRSRSDRRLHARRGKGDQNIQWFTCYNNIRYYAYYITVAVYGTNFYVNLALVSTNNCLSCVQYIIHNAGRNILQYIIHYHYSNISSCVYIAPASLFVFHCPTSTCNDVASPTIDRAFFIFLFFFFFFI